MSMVRPNRSPRPRISWLPIRPGGGAARSHSRSRATKLAGSSNFRSAESRGVRLKWPAFLSGIKKVAKRGGLKMKTGFLASAAIAAAILLAVPAAAAEYVTILLEKVVNRTPDQTWAKIGPYCSISQWMNFSCVITAGNGAAAGTIRRLGGVNDEIIVAATPYS